mmetsp:Transcript_28799/g.91980  ORF Transcript_28799/g.91980 Transcript_28799/m.91980 type:complete len:209 (+) Transcript_28799:82-708(+)
MHHPSSPTTQHLRATRRHVLASAASGRAGRSGRKEDDRSTPSPGWTCRPWSAGPSATPGHLRTTSADAASLWPASRRTCRSTRPPAGRSLAFHSPGTAPPEEREQELPHIVGRRVPRHRPRLARMVVVQDLVVERHVHHGWVARGAVGGVLPDPEHRALEDLQAVGMLMPGRPVIMQKAHVLRHVIPSLQKVRPVPRGIPPLVPLAGH